MLLAVHDSAFDEVADLVVIHAQRPKDFMCVLAGRWHTPRSQSWRAAEPWRGSGLHHTVKLVDVAALSIVRVPRGFVDRQYGYDAGVELIEILRRANDPFLNVADDILRRMRGFQAEKGQALANREYLVELKLCGRLPATLPHSLSRDSPRRYRQSFTAPI